MQNVWFISDTHFSHKNVLNHEPDFRPFKTIEEHDAVLIENWNKVVKTNDIVWHLGDFCMGGKKSVEIAGQLNGYKRLVMGNHDVYGVELYAKYFERIYGAFHYKEFILTHIPIRKVYHPDMVNIHGHLHSKIVENYIHVGVGLSTKHEWQADNGYVNVSVERINLTPIHIDDIRKKVREAI